MPAFWWFPSVTSQALWLAIVLLGLVLWCKTNLLLIMWTPLGGMMSSQMPMSHICWSSFWIDHSQRSQSSCCLVAPGCGGSANGPGNKPTSEASTSSSHSSLSIMVPTWSWVSQSSIVRSAKALAASWHEVGGCMPLGSAEVKFLDPVTVPLPAKIDFTYDDGQIWCLGCMFRDASGSGTGTWGGGCWVSGSKPLSMSSMWGWSSHSILCGWVSTSSSSSSVNWWVTRSGSLFSLPPASPSPSCSLTPPGDVSKTMLCLTVTLHFSGHI